MVDVKALRADDDVAKSRVAASKDDFANSTAPERHRSYGLCRRWFVCAALLIAAYLSSSWSGTDLHDARTWLVSMTSWHEAAAIDAPLPSLGPDYIFHHLAQHGPYRPIAQYRPPPTSCTIDKVIILQRHGARYPTTGALRAMHRLVDRLEAASVNVSHPDAHKFAFLKDMRLTLGEESLVPYGHKEARYSGREAYLRYSHLAEKGTFIRSSSSSRVVHSSKLWSEGFTADNYTGPKLPAALVISDADGSNDTLANNNCPGWKRSPAEWQWASVFTPSIAKRIEDVFTRDSELSLSAFDVITLFWLCAFDSVSKESTSPFCHVFTAEDFVNFEYYQDLEKYYNRGYGNALGAVQGIGWSREMLARLTGHPVEDHTQTNTTLNADPKNFPLHRGIYSDFSHDNTIAAIAAAVGLFDDAARLPLSHVQKDRSWRFGNIAPFSGRIVVERLACGGRGTHVRILGNDAVLSIKAGSGMKDSLGQGVYKLADFVMFVMARLKEIETVWPQCHESAPDEGEVARYPTN